MLNPLQPNISVNNYSPELLQLVIISFILMA